MHGSDGRYGASSGANRNPLGLASRDCEPWESTAPRRPGPHGDGMVLGAAPPGVR
jgi:hypothetical protein